MAKQYEPQLACWKSLESNKRIIPLELWKVFDCLFTNNVIEAKEIFVDNDYKVSRMQVAIIIGLVHSSAAFLHKIKTSEKNDLDDGGVLVFDSDITELVHHCLGNDLNIISQISENFTAEEIKERKEHIEKAFGEIFELINRLKTLTKG